MPFMPFHILGIWLRGLLAVAILAGGVYALRSWYRDSYTWEEPRPEAVAVPVLDATGKEIGRRVEEPGPGRWAWRFEPGANRPTAELAAAIGLLTWGLAGGLIARGVARLRLKAGPDEPGRERGGDVRRIRRPDGSELRVEIYGPPDAPPIVLTHGWGADATEWYYEKERLAGRFRLIAWDLPGLGLSTKPDNDDYSLENLARDLDAVLELAGGRPAILMGHSIGGMITLTFCRLFPEALGTRVAGLVLVHTTYTNPVRTTKNAGLMTALEKPVLIPMMHLMIGLWPVVWALNWLSYLNGSVHRSTHKDGFAGTETRGQLDMVAGYLPRDRPDVLARGMLGMIRYDATAVLPTIGVPTLVVVADGDTSCLPEAGEVMARSIPGATLETLSPARHMGLIERNERFDAAVAGFAAACLGAGTTAP